VTPRATPFVTAIDRVSVDDPFGNRIELIEEGNG
jgi:hypothetical protein